MAVAGHSALIAVATGASATYASMDGVVSFGIDRPRELLDLTAFDDGSTRRRFASLVDLGLSINGDLEADDTATRMLKAAFRNETPIYVRVLYNGTTIGVMSAFLVESFDVSGSVEGKNEVSISLRADGSMEPVELEASSGAAPTISITALPYTRTVAMGSITISGTTTNTPTSITWSASPSGASGSVSGDLTNWSTSVAISPVNSGEGVETITFTATNANGSGTADVTVGFYVAGAHSWFNAQNINGAYNSGMVNNDSITTWENLGSYAVGVTQGTAGSKPTYKTSVVGGQPTVYFDGGDILIAASGATTDWNFLTQDLVTSECVTRVTDSNSFATIWSTLGATNGGYVGIDNRVSSTGDVYVRHSGNNAADTTDPYDGTKFNLIQGVRDDSGASDVIAYLNASNVATAVGVSVSAQHTLQIGDDNINVTLTALTGDIFRIALYDLAFTATQRAINKAVDEWALNGTFPITV